MDKETESSSNAKAITVAGVWAGLSKFTTLTEGALTAGLYTLVRSLPPETARTILAAEMTTVFTAGVIFDLWAYLKKGYCATWPAGKIIEKMGGRFVIPAIFAGTATNYLIDFLINPVTNFGRLFEKADFDFYIANYMAKGMIGIVCSFGINTAIRRDALDPWARRITRLEDWLTAPMRRFNFWLGPTGSPDYPDGSLWEKEAATRQQTRRENPLQFLFLQMH